MLLNALGCVTKGKYDLVVVERDGLEHQRKELAQRVEQLEASNTSLSSERERVMDEMEDLRIAKGQLDVDVRRLSRTKAELSESLEITSEQLAARDAEIQSMRGTYDALVEDLQEEVTAGQIQIERLRSGLKMNLSQEILFASGSAAVNSGGTRVLRKVAAQLSELDYDIAVVGHSDNVPIGNRYPSNWELAAARASSVVRLLASGGVDPQRLSAVSRGEFEPIASNDTPEGRSTNRRIEITLAQRAGLQPPPDESTAQDAVAPAQPVGNSEGSAVVETGGAGPPDVATPPDAAETASPDAAVH